MPATETRTTRLAALKTVRAAALAGKHIVITPSVLRARAKSWARTCGYDSTDAFGKTLIAEFESAHTGRYAERAMRSPV